MSDVDALTAFIRARLDEEERDAKAAQPGPWNAEASPHVVTEDGGTVAAYVEGWTVEPTLIDEADARHIARQDPAATLARVAALRALVDLHEPTKCASYWHETKGGFVDNGLICDICANHDREDGVTGEWPCTTMRHIAAIWRDHPDFPAEATP